MKPNLPIIVVLGGYGVLGQQFCYALAKDNRAKIVIAGRQNNKAKALAEKLKSTFSKSDISYAVLDTSAPDFKDRLIQTEATLVVNMAGPYLDQTYQVSRICIGAKMHYLDLAEVRDTVVNISLLEEDAKQKGVVVLSGASLFPGLTSVIIDKYALHFSTLRVIEFGVAQGSQAERGLARVKTILLGLGKPFQRLNNGQEETVYGGQNLHRFYYGDNVGMRWQADYDLPELTLLKQRYPKLSTIKFHLGIEPKILQGLIWLLSWIPRSQICDNLGFLARPFLWVSRILKGWGSDLTGLYIHLYGTDFEYQPHDIRWNLVLQTKHGINLPIIPTLILSYKILQGEIEAGARPCFGAFTLEEFDEMAQRWNIYHTLEEQQL